MSGGSASVLDVLQFHVILQHSSPLNCRCRSVLEHRSSNLGSVIEFPRSCTLLESKRSIQLLRLTVQQASANMTCVSNVFSSSDNHSFCALSSQQISSPIRAHVHLQRCFRRLWCIRQSASPVFSPSIEPTSWVLACVHSVALSHVL